MSIAVVVNPRARRGSDAVARECRARLPGARVVTSRSLEECASLVRDLSDPAPAVVVSAGGDGTAIGLINSARDAAGSGVRAPWISGAGAPTTALGVLPLGTGNAWARVTGARDWRRAITQLGALSLGAPLPVRRFDLVDVDGQLAHFAGTGWDAELIDDFHAQKDALGLLPRRLRGGLAGYLYGMFTRTLPRHVTRRGVEVELVNTGSDALTVDDEGRAVPLPGGERGAVLYRGPVTVCAAGTTPEWGFGFRAFPFADLVPGRFCMRVYAGGAADALWHLPQLWRGEHPCPRMHTWLLDRCHATFSRPVPFQIGGDRIDHKTEVEYRLAGEWVNLLDWRKLPN
jgi:diacylglycerol kinase family enzyme